MKRRNFITAVTATAAMGGLSSCSKTAENCSETSSTKIKPIKWKMVTTWPKNFQGLGEGAEFLAKIINEMGGGRLQVKVYGSGELVPALQTFDAVSSGTAEMGHGASYYWKGKMQPAPFFTTVPFGLTATEMQGWLVKAGGYELWRELYQPFGVRPFIVGNTGVQMAGWFNKEINSLEDIKGLKMRIPGLGGEVLARAGGTPVLIPGSEVFTALETGAVDAAEWVGPYNDLAMGLYKAAEYYYYPGWHEPGTTAEALVNQQAFDKLPKDLQMIVEQACHAANMDMQADFTAKNNSALQVMVEQHKVKLRKLPDDVLIKLKELSEQVVAETAEGSELGQKILTSYNQYKKQVRSWSKISDHAYVDSIRL
ncbi:MAG: ABC transporter substrate-binding protein [Gammaproteobacteria bacterium]|nr:MAG: ABC transporter substrate-binding protein [Gammaproteobacteria bacterium]